MATTAASLIDKARELLQDTNAQRWSDSELLGWLNDGQLEAVRLNPEVSVHEEDIDSLDGYRFTLDTLGLTKTPLRLIDITHNGANSPVSPIDRREIDDVFPGWRTSTPGADVTHYTFDSRNPKAFYVFPPAAAAQLHIVYSATPDTVASTVATINVDDIYGPLLINYICYRAILKDAEYADNAALAEKYYKLFSLGITGKSEADKAVEPVPGTPPRG
jgi:hypothetical protein